MPKPEQLLWMTLGPMLRPYGHFERVENAFGSGMPDVNFCISGQEGWIELKSRDRWPLGCHVPIALLHYTPEQRRWARKRARAGGSVWWLLRVCERVPAYVLLDGLVAANLYENDAPTKDVLLDNAAWATELVLTPPAIRTLAQVLAHSVHVS